MRNSEITSCLEKMGEAFLLFLAFLCIIYDIICKNI